MTPELRKRLALISILILVLYNLPFLPGPSFLNIPAQLFYTVGEILSLLGLLFVIIGAVWNIAERRRENRNPRRLRQSIYMFVISLVFVGAMIVSNQFRHLSRNIAIRRASGLIEQIEDYKAKHGNYPKTLELAGIKQPSTFVVGITGYSYNKIQDNYSLTFYQNVLFWFNYEVVVFDKTDRHQSDGELPILYASKYDHWKYYIYD